MGTRLGFGAGRGHLLPLGRHQREQGVHDRLDPEPRRARHIHQRCIRPLDYARTACALHAWRSTLSGVAGLPAARCAGAPPAASGALARDRGGLARDGKTTVRYGRSAVDRSRPGRGRARGGSPLASCPDPTAFVAGSQLVGGSLIRRIKRKSLGNSIRSRIAPDGGPIGCPTRRLARAPCRLVVAHEVVSRSRLHSAATRARRRLRRLGECEGVKLGKLFNQS